MDNDMDFSTTAGRRSVAGQMVEVVDLEAIDDEYIIVRAELDIKEEELKRRTAELKKKEEEMMAMYDREVTARFERLKELKAELIQWDESIKERQKRVSRREEILGKGEESEEEDDDEQQTAEEMSMARIKRKIKRGSGRPAFELKYEDETAGKSRELPMRNVLLSYIFLKRHHENLDLQGTDEADDEEEDDDDDDMITFYDNDNELDDDDDETDFDAFPSIKTTIERPSNPLLTTDHTETPVATIAHLDTILARPGPSTNDTIEPSTSEPNADEVSAQKTKKKSCLRRLVSWLFSCGKKQNKCNKVEPEEQH